jgi:DnaJ-class molecular chaperone
MTASHLDELATCPECDGAGEINFNRSRNRDPQCDESAPCGVCHGEGVVTYAELMEYDPANQGDGFDD